MGFQVVVMFIDSFKDDIAYVRDQKNCVCAFFLSVRFIICKTEWKMLFLFS
jgi:hypothetical protein